MIPYCIAVLLMSSPEDVRMPHICMLARPCCHVHHEIMWISRSGLLPMLEMALLQNDEAGDRQDVIHVDGAPPFIVEEGGGFSCRQRGLDKLQEQTARHRRKRLWAVDDAAA